MQLKNFLLATLSTLVAASPTPADLEARGCKVVYPATDGWSQCSRRYDPPWELNEHIVFQIPAGSPGPCDLKLHFDNEWYPALWENTQVEFKYMGGTGTTYTFVKGPLDRYIGSFGCKETMEFDMTISKEQGKPGYVGFPQNEGSGLYMTYGC